MPSTTLNGKEMASRSTALETSLTYSRPPTSSPSTRLWLRHGTARSIRSSVRVEHGDGKERSQPW